MRILGLSALSHDAAAAVVEDGEICFAAHAERYSRCKNDPDLNAAIIDEALSFGRPDVIAWYERPLLKKTRQAFAGQWTEVWNRENLPSVHLKALGLDGIPIRYVDHHVSHAAAGFLTSPFDDAAIIVADAIGEWSCMLLGEWSPPNGPRWHYRARYPHSLGLLYSAFTQRCHLKPNEEEYILMGMAAYGSPIHRDAILRDLVTLTESPFLLRLNENPHLGIGEWLPDARPEDLAASIQAVTETIMTAATRWLASRTGSSNLVLMGGVALNCVANREVVRTWQALKGEGANVWIMPNPGDAGSSLGAALAVHGRRVTWSGPYLGTDIDRPFDLDGAVKALMAGEVIGVANGRAEFGPRALGNRSLLADPRGPDVKDKVNAIKRRQKFRPFAPAILEEHTNAVFDMPLPRTPYMQYVVDCKKPDTYPAIIHADGTSRVQTVNAIENPRFYALIEKFHHATGCPLLLNTSLNIRGEPLVNSWNDALRFQERYSIRMF